MVTSADGTAILVHGSAVDRGDWGLVVPHLADAFTVHAMDRRGRGGSGDGPAYALAREAEDVAAVVQSIGAPVAVLAHSYGALVALEAARISRGIAKLSLYEPPFFDEADPEVAAPLEALLAAGDHEGVTVAS